MAGNETQKSGIEILAEKMEGFVGKINDAIIERMTRFIEQGVQMDVQLQEGKDETLIIVIRKKK